MAFDWVADVGNYVVCQVRFRVFLTFCNLLRLFAAARLSLGIFRLFFLNGASLKNGVLWEKTIFFLNFNLFLFSAGLVVGIWGWSLGLWVDFAVGVLGVVGIRIWDCLVIEGVGGIEVVIFHGGEGVEVIGCVFWLRVEGGHWGVVVAVVHGNDNR